MVAAYETYSDHETKADLGYSKVLERASLIAREAKTDPSSIKLRLKMIGGIGLVGVLGVFLTLSIIMFVHFESDQTKILATFILCSFGVLIFASLVASVIVSWSALIYKHVAGLYDIDNAHEATEHLAAIMGVLEDSKEDDGLDKEVETLVAAEYQKIGNFHTDSEQELSLALHDRKLGQKVARIVVRNLEENVRRKLVWLLGVNSQEHIPGSGDSDGLLQGKTG